MSRSNQFRSYHRGAKSTSAGRLSFPEFIHLAQTSRSKFVRLSSSRRLNSPLIEQVLINNLFDSVPGLPEAVYSKCWDSDDSFNSNLIVALEKIYNYNYSYISTNNFSNSKPGSGHASLSDSSFFSSDTNTGHIMVNSTSSFSESDSFVSFEGSSVEKDWFDSCVDQAMNESEFQSDYF
ncbi:hypothetical protein AYI68_g4923 [Smittium mucronatum]|uniref:Uncharacterized protein n=1 Tax=Smittium mucronatum TaxID=133383 RepID=A0A1R0GVP8_9FUNG|nr:hypothetical protein AYI68_g4923 [Smittium mucronatum]